MFIKFDVKLPENKTDNLVKEALVERGYEDHLQIKSYILDDDKIDYIVKEKVIYHGEIYPKITRLTCSQYMELLCERLSLQSESKYQVYPQIHSGQISYQVLELNSPNRVKMRRNRRGI